MSHTGLQHIFPLLIQLPKEIVHFPSQSQPGFFLPILRKLLFKISLYFPPSSRPYLLVFRYVFNQQYIYENELPIYQNKQLYILNINIEVDHQTVYKNGFSSPQNEQLYIQNVHTEAYPFFVVATLSKYQGWWLKEN